MCDKMLDHMQMRVFIPFQPKKMVRHRDGLPRASKLRHVAHLTGCKMLWLAHIPIILRLIMLIRLIRKFILP